MPSYEDDFSIKRVRRSLAGDDGEELPSPDPARGADAPESADDARPSAPVLPEPAPAVAPVHSPAAPAPPQAPYGVYPPQTAYSYGNHPVPVDRMRAGGNEDEFNLRAYMEVLRRYRSLIVLLTLLGAVGAGLHLYLRKPQYLGAVNVIEVPRENMLERSSGFSVDKTDIPVSGLEDIFRLEEARGLIRKFYAERVDGDLAAGQLTSVQYAALKKVNVLDGAEGGIGEFKIVLHDASDRIFWVQGASFDRLTTVYGVNAATAALLELDASIQDKHLDAIGEKLTAGLKDANADVSKARINLGDALAEEAARHGSLSIDRDSFQKVLVGYERQLEESRLHEEILNIKLENLRTQLKHGLPQFGVQGTNTLEAQHVQLEQERARLLSRYTPEHPKVQKINDQIEEIQSMRKKGLQAQIESVDQGNPVQLDIVKSLSGLIAEKEAVSARVKALDGLIVKHRERLDASSAETEKINRLRDEEQSAQNVYNFLRLKLIQFNMTRQANRSRFKVLEWATATSVKIQKPNYPLIMMCGVAGGFAFALFLAFVLNHLDNTIRSPLEAEIVLKLPCVGWIPKSEGGADGIVNPDDPHSFLSESLAHIRNAVRYCGDNRPEKLVLITSALKGEGKSFTALNLAISFTMEGNSVLLVDADLQNAYRGGITAFLGFEGQTGLAEYLEDASDYVYAVHPTMTQNLFLLPTGNFRANSAKLFRSASFDRLVETAEKDFDIVIFDSSPILPIVDASIIAHRMRGRFLVIDAAKTPVNAVRIAQERLMHMKVPATGIILNRFASSEMGYDYKYGSYYGGG